MFVHATGTRTEPDGTSIVMLNGTDEPGSEESYVMLLRVRWTVNEEP